LMSAFKHLVQDRTGFEVFLAESAEIVAQVCGHKLDHDHVLLKRALHTLKGTSGSMGLSVIAALCHSLESELVENDRIPAQLPNASAARGRAMPDPLANSGLRGQRTVEIPEKDYADHLAFAADNAVPRRELAQKLAAWQAEPVERAFRRLGDQAIGLA